MVCAYCYFGRHGTTRLVLTDVVHLVVHGECHHDLVAMVSRGWWSDVLLPFGGVLGGSTADSCSDEEEDKEAEMTGRGESHDWGVAWCRPPL